MSVPTHGPRCTTRGWQTRCRWCGSPVYYFDCSCGSKVFFRSPGHPWPKHECAGWMAEQYEQQGASPDRGIELLYDWGARKGKKIDDWLVDKLRNKARRQEAARKGVVLRVEPGKKSRDFAGEVIQLNRQVNFYRRFDLPRNSISEQILGRLTTQRYFEIIIRERHKEAGQIRKELQGFIPRRIVREQGLRIRDRVLVGVAPFSLPGERAKVWLVTSVFIRGEGP